MKEVIKQHWHKPALMLAGCLITAVFNIAGGDEDKTNTQIVTEALTLPYRTAEKLEMYKYQCEIEQAKAFSRDSIQVSDNTIFRADLNVKLQLLNESVTEISKRQASIDGKLDGLIEGLKFRQDFGFVASKNDSTKPCSNLVTVE